MSKSTFGKLLIAACVLGSAFLNNVGAASSAERTLADIKTDGAIRIGVEGVFVPFSYRENGKLVGYDVDLANVLFKDLGVKIEFIDTQWSGIVPALLARKFDIIMSSLSYTKERMDKVSFSVPYADSSLAMLVRVADQNNVKSFNDMAGRPIGLKAGTPEEVALPEFNAKVKAATGKGFGEVKVFDSDPLSVLALRQGTVDGVISNMVNLSVIMKQQPGEFAIVQKVAGRSLAGIGIHKQDKQLQNYIDEHLVTATKSGQMAELQKKWFGIAFDLPTDVPIMK